MVIIRYTGNVLLRKYMPLHFFEEAEYGYRKAFECGDINLDTFTLWTDVFLQYFR